jgi:quercetin dioxygenase-like cupin family protein
MIIKQLEDAPAINVEGYENIKKQIILGPEDGSHELIMRHFTMEPGSGTPYHQHPFPHLVIITGGSGIVIDSMGEEHLLNPGDYVYVQDDDLHGFKNDSGADFSFICVVPVRGEA